MLWILVGGVALIFVGFLVLFFNARDNTSSMEKVANREVTGVVILLVGLLFILADAFYLIAKAMTKASPMLFLPAICMGQVKVSQMQERWQVVDPPSRPVYIQPWTTGDHYTLSGRWGYPFQTPNPAGVFDVYNAIVSKEQKVCAWSQPKRLTLRSGWRLNAGSWNLPPSRLDAGVIWKVKVISTVQPSTVWTVGKEFILSTNYESDAVSTWSIAPWSSTAPVLQQLRWLTYNDQYFKLANLTYGGPLTSVASPPVVIPTQMPLLNCSVAYAYETSTGMTTLSPPATFTVPPLPAGWSPSDTCTFGFILQDPLPMGALGYRVYVKFDAAKSWKCVPGPHCTKDAPDPLVPDDWRFQPDDQQVYLTRAPVGPAPQAVATPQSYLTKLQVAMLDNPGKSIEVDEQYTILYCPIIHHLDVGGVSNVGRKISGSSDGSFRIRQANSDYWPAWVNYSSYTRLVGADILSNGSAAMTLSSPTGSCSFGLKMTECSFVCGARSDALTQGVRIREEGAGVGYHSASECRFIDCIANAPVGFWIAHQQTANIQFDTVHSSSFFPPDRRHSSFWISTPNTVTMRNGVYVDCPNNVLFNTSGADINGQNLWNDRSAISVMDCHGAASSMKIDIGKLNIRTGGSGEVAMLIRNFNTVRESVCKLDSIVTQYDNDTPKFIECLSYQVNRLGLTYDGGDLGKTIQLREPTLQEMLTAAGTIYGPGNGPYLYDIPPPGYRINIPGLTITSTVNANAPVVVPSTTVYFNSLTAGAIKRVGWMSP